MTSRSPSVTISLTPFREGSRAWLMPNSEWRFWRIAVSGPLRYFGCLPFSVRATKLMVWLAWSQIGNVKRSRKRFFRYG
jgi:hypothetical protein